MTTTVDNTPIVRPLSRAAQFLADHETDLVAARDTVQAVALERFAAMTKADIRARLEVDENRTMGYATPKASASHADHVEVAVRRTVARSDEEAALRAARRAVSDEQIVNEAMASIEREGAAMAETVATQTADATTPLAASRMLATFLRRNAVDVLVSVAAAEHAAEWRIRLDKGQDPRDAAPEMARRLMATVSIAAKDAGMRRVDDIGHRADAMAATGVLRELTALLPDDVKAMMTYLY